MPHSHLIPYDLSPISALLVHTFARKHLAAGQVSRPCCGHDSTYLGFCVKLFLSALSSGLRGAPASWSRQVSFIPCDHEYLSFKGAKLSKSRGAFVEVPYFLSRYDPDPLRFYLTAAAPETRDTELALRPPKGQLGRISSSATALS
jgi:leucyl-tRNA synthetase